MTVQYTEPTPTQAWGGLTTEPYGQQPNGQLWTPPAPPVVVPQLQPWMTLSLLVHAYTKMGKSTLAATAPRPLLILDAEGSSKFLPFRTVPWDPYQPPPHYDGSWDACVVTVFDWSVLQAVYTWITQYKLPFVSVVLDSVTEIQRRLKRNLRGSEGMKIQTWGQLLDVMSDQIRNIRDLTLQPWSPIQVVVCVAESQFDGAKGKWIPSMEGKIVTRMPYWFDVVGYLYAKTLNDENGQPTRECRALWIAPHPQFEAGERVQGRLGREQDICASISPEGVIQAVGTDITDWMYKIYPQR